MRQKNFKNFKNYKKSKSFGDIVEKQPRRVSDEKLQRLKALKLYVSGKKLKFQWTESDKLHK